MRRRFVSVLLAVAAMVAGLGVVPVAGASVPAAVAASAPKCTRSLAGSTSSTAGQSPSARPVILVHGWTGTAMTDTAKQLKATLGAKISTFTFDYSKWAADWPTNANIAPCLADYVHNVSDAYRNIGGDGKVILVAHSMGGLAIRYASSATYVQNPITASIAPLVISLDTPHLGSFWGGTAAPLAKEVGGAVLGKSVPNPFGTDGGMCLQPHENGGQLPAQCGGLPPWLPGGTTLDEIAGDITIKRTLLGVHLYDVETSNDGIVAVSSSVGYRTSGPGGTAPVVSSPTQGTTIHSQYVKCSVTTGQLHKGLDVLYGAVSSDSVAAAAVNDWAAMKDPNSLSMWLAAASAVFTASCSHTHITTDAAAISQVAADIDSYLKAHPTSPGLASTTWVGTDKFFQLVRLTFSSNTSASIYTLQPGDTEFRPMDCMGACSYRWSVTGNHFTVNEADNIWTWSGDFSATTINGIATYIRGAQHAFTLTRQDATSCPSSTDVQSSQQASARISRLKFACFNGFASVVFDVKPLGASTFNTTVSVWKQTGTRWMIVDRATACSDGTLPKWIVDGACQVS